MHELIDYSTRVQGGPSHHYINFAMAALKTGSNIILTWSNKDRDLFEKVT